LFIKIYQMVNSLNMLNFNIIILKSFYYFYYFSKIKENHFFDVIRKHKN